jgi:hypothetical protein
MYAQREPPQDPPCDTCREELSEDNEDAARVYQLVKRQVRVAPGSGEIIDLDYAAVKAIMDILRVKNPRDCFEKVSRAFHHFLSERADRG